MPPPVRRAFPLAVAGVVALAASLTAAPATAREAPPEPRAVAPRGALTAAETATIELFRRARPSVVYITTTERVVDLFTFNARDVPRGTGSGIVWDERGHLVTNWHVVAGARSVQVRLADQRSVTARVVGRSRDHDLAVLRIELADRHPPPIAVGTSRDLAVGQHVFAIGNPYGFDHTLTSGLISALDRTLDGDDRPIHGLIQTDATINPGNSGGPLLDSAGRLIGVNTAIYSPTGTSTGIGFAIPVDTVNRVVPEIIAYGRYRAPTLGIATLDAVNAAWAAHSGRSGAVILRLLAGSPAQQAGLRAARTLRDGSIVPGDVLTAIDDEPIDGSSTHDRALSSRRVGDRVTLTLLREGKPVKVVVTLAGSTA